MILTGFFEQKQTRENLLLALLTLSTDKSYLFLDTHTNDEYHIVGRLVIILLLVVDYILNYFFRSLMLEALIQ